MSLHDNDAYWAANKRLMAGCLVVWALVSFGFGILLRPLLSGVTFGGTDLGFWFAQQGSILTFIVLIFFYAFRMNALDRKFGVDESAAPEARTVGTPVARPVGTPTARPVGTPEARRVGTPGARR